MCDTPKRNTLPQRKSSSCVARSRPGGSEETLCRGVSSPGRTPVTENDPLGALGDLAVSEPPLPVPQPPPPAPTHLPDGAPALFDRRAPGDWAPVARSHTFSGDSDEEPASSMPRSSTMPTDPPSSALTSISSFKLPFGRYSPGRFSLRKAAEKAAEIKITSQLFENAINNFSASSLTSKKSNEILMGGLSTLKSAATSVAKKFDEIKEAISANSTPIKAGNHSRRGTLEREYLEDESDDGSSGQPPRRKVSVECSPDWDRTDSLSNLAAYFSEVGGSQMWLGGVRPQRDTNIPIAMQVMLTTCSRCHHCASLLYDEEIMAGWLPEDSNLNTKCQFCDKGMVPLLCVTVIDYRGSPMPSSSRDSSRKQSTLSLGASRGSMCGDGEEKLTNGGLNTSSSNLSTQDPITVPYLNPLVLRKEFESILATEGDSSLTQPKFVDQHPIIYWNMVWVFARIGVESHMSGLALGASTCSIKDPHASWANADSASVLISTLWHNNLLNEEAGQPMFMLWNQQEEEQSPLVNALVTDHSAVPRLVMERVMSSLQCSDLVQPLRTVARERPKWKGRGHSLYRDILFLAMTALGRDNIDQGAFDREYVSAYKKVMERESKLLMKCDQPLSQASLFCRHYFRPLDL